MEQSIEEKKKLQWQTDRAEKGSDTAQLALGMRYLEGKGINKDPKKARKWLEAAAKQGNADAKKALAEHPELPPPDPVQPTEKPVQPTVRPAQDAVRKP
jgi:TPR repeat protein